MAWSPGTPVRIETARYVVRSVTASDVTEQYLAWFRDAEVMQFIGPELGRLTKEQHLSIVQSADNRSRMLLVVESREDRSHAGVIRVQLEPRHHRAQTSVILGERTHRRRGALLETHRAVRRFLFAEAAVEKLTYSVYSGHTQMIALLEHLPGAVKEGVLVHHEFLPGLGWQDVHLYAMFTGES